MDLLPLARAMLLTGVVGGIAASDYAGLLRASPAGASVYAATGSAHSIASGRLAYEHGLHGPSRRAVQAGPHRHLLHALRKRVGPLLLA